MQDSGNIHCFDPVLNRLDVEPIMDLSDALNAADRFLGQLFFVITVDDAGQKDLFLFDLISHILSRDETALRNGMSDQLVQLMRSIDIDVL